MNTDLTGTSIIGDSRGGKHAPVFSARNPATGDPIEPEYSTATTDEVTAAAALACEAAGEFGRCSGAKKAGFLRAIAEELEFVREAIVQRAHLETALPPARLESELARTTGQLRLFASLVEEGSWVDARIDHGDPARTPVPKPDVRSMMRPLGPVAVFCASNFPLAFSVAGGDTASAFAAGCPVVVNGHFSHPGTAELAGLAIRRAVRRCELPVGVFSLLFGAGHDTGLALVEHPSIAAVSFTGSRRGGEALMEAAASRPVPIPAYMEMSSTNPTVILSGALESRGVAIAEGLFNSATLGAGQFCTNPGVVFIPSGGASEKFSAELKRRFSAAGPFTMLNAGIQQSYARMLDDRSNYPSLELLATSPSRDVAGYVVEASLFRTRAALFASHPEFQEEMFGPSILLVTYESVGDLFAALSVLHGHLTASVHAREEELGSNPDLLRLLESRAGRLLLNGYPTGVEVCHAMVHGGPYPSTSDSRTTSVGTRAIYRFVRPVCYQNFPQSALPEELHDSNPLGILRMVNGVLSGKNS